MSWMNAKLWRSQEEEWTSNYYITWMKTGSQSVSLEIRWVGDKSGRENQHPAEWALRPPIEQLQLERRCWIEEHVPERLGPQAPGWAAQENGKETRLGLIELGSIGCSSVRSPTPSHKQPFQIQWEVYFSKNCVARLYCVVVMILHADASAYEYTIEWLWALMP